MDALLATPLLAGLSPQVFMRRHWQKKPLLVRGAVPADCQGVSRAELFELASREDVESRLVVHGDAGWTLRSGPLPRRALPPLGRAGWTLLVQGVDLHVPAARTLLERFRFLPDARLDDLMVSFASDGGGVGPHVDSYDVFLLQLQGRRRWRIGPVTDPATVPDVPLKILARFEPAFDWLLDAGDLLYLPPGWAHDGVADGACLTASIGFRAPGRDELGRDILQRALDAADPDARGPLYRDPTQAATDRPGEIPAALQAFGAAAAARLLGDPHALACALGEVLSEPKPSVCFDRTDGPRADPASSLRLDARSRMLYDERFVFLNGESYRASGRDAQVMRRLADSRELDATALATLSTGARALLDQWLAAGWVVPVPANGPKR